jgi:hypothetical protein
MAFSMPESVEDAGEVGGQVVDVVFDDAFRLAAVAIAALVGRDDPETGRGERRNLVAPGIGQLGKAVAQDDRHAILGAGLVHGDLDAVAPDHAGGGKVAHL